MYVFFLGILEAIKKQRDMCNLVAMIRKYIYIIIYFL